MPKITGTLQDALDNIRAVCDNNGLVFNLEYVKGEEVGARVRIAFVRPENRSRYMQLLIAGTHAIGGEDIVEEECLLEIDWSGTEWEHEFTQTITSNIGVVAGIKDVLNLYISANSPGRK